MSVFYSPVVIILINTDTVAGSWQQQRIRGLWEVIRSRRWVSDGRILLWNQSYRMWCDICIVYYFSNLEFKICASIESVLLLFWIFCHLVSVILSILIASTATSWSLYKRKQLSSRNPAEPWRTSATPPSSSNRRNRRAGRTQRWKPLNTHVCVVTQTTDSSDLWLWHWSRSDKQTVMKDRNFISAQSITKTTQKYKSRSKKAEWWVLFF